MDFSNDSAVVPKICGIFIFSFIAVIFGLLPMVVYAHFKRKPDTNTNSRRKYKLLLSHMSGFGGGVLLSTTFLHLLPEIRKSIERLRHKNVFNYKESLQLSELLMCLGFLFLYLIEEVADRLVTSRNKMRGDGVCVETFASNVYNMNQLTNASITGQGSIESKINGTSHNDCEDHALDVLKCKNNEGIITNADCANSTHCHNDNTIFFTESSGKNFLLIFALSIHEGFEGLAIGLEHQSEAVWYMVLGVGAHKAIIALCIGFQMISSKLDRKLAIIYVFVFATATSIGVGIGLFLYMESGLFSVILQGLATGTLLHVVFFELLKPHSDHTPFSGVFLGFVSMAVLKYFSP